MIEIRNPESKELASILELLDREFVYSRDRSIGLKDRYPDLFSEKNLHNLFALFNQNAPISFIAVREAIISNSGKHNKVYFIGSVYTKEEYRGMGFGLKLLEKVDETYLQRNFAAGILWTTIHNYYSKLGWNSYPNGYFVNCSGRISTNQNVQSEQFDLETIDKGLLNNLWRKNESSELKLERNFESYNTWATLPLPAIKCKVILKQAQGYLIYGTYGDAAYLYEIVALNEMIRNELIIAWLNSDTIKTYYLNLNPGNSIDKKFLEKYFKKVDYRRQETGMYKITDADFKDTVINTPIPYLDRI